MMNKALQLLRRVGVPTFGLIAGILSFLFTTSGASGGESKPGFAVRAVSSKPGHLFTDGEPVDMRVLVTGAKGPVTVTYAIEETDGPWCETGKVMLSNPDDGSKETGLPLSLPRRGLYKLQLNADSGEAIATAQTWVAVVFAPSAPDPESPWGVFWVPFGGEPQDIARSVRLLGASWVRFNFFGFGKITIEEGPEPEIAVDYSPWKRHAEALRAEGLFLMGDVLGCPPELASKPRSKPRDYALWDQLMQKVAAGFRDEIQVWEIWNEPDLSDYWEGTAQEYLELVKHTSRALRRGNPDARIAPGGFTEPGPFVEELLQLGLAQHIDILTVHYTDNRPHKIDRWQGLVERHDLSLPIWNSEEVSEVPLRNLASLIQPSFKFLHVGFAFPRLRPLVRTDLTVLPAGIAFSVGANCIGTGRFIGRSTKVPGFDVYFFQRGDEIVGAFQRSVVRDRRKLFGPKAASVILALEPLEAGISPTVTDILGRSRELRVNDGEAAISLKSALRSTSMTPPTLFVNGTARMEVLQVNEVAGDDGTRVFEAESGEWSKGWAVEQEPDSFGGSFLGIWAQDEPDDRGYWVELRVGVRESGRYQVIFSGNPLDRLRKPRTLSPFAWHVDGDKTHVMERPGTQLGGFLGAVEGLSVLGTISLDEGEHIFRLQLTGRRDQPDNRYALWFDAIVLRPVTGSHQSRGRIVRWSLSVYFRDIFEH